MKQKHARSILTLCLLLAATGVWADPKRPLEEPSFEPGLLPPDTESRVDNWIHQSIDLMYQGSPTKAMRLAKAIAKLAPEDPRPYLVQARILRLDAPDQNLAHEHVDLKLAPIDSLLEITVSKSEKLLKQDKNSLAGLLYRSWALLFQSQLRVLGGHYWGAGQKAKAGKKDLDKLLKLAPDNADARFLEGTYLYFADTLPGTMKVARFLIRIPGGNADKGIRSLQFAATQNGYTKYDARAILAVALFGFEGRYEDALKEFAIIDREFPHSARLHEPMAVIHLFRPSGLQHHLAKLEVTASLNWNSPEPWIRKVAYRLKLYQAVGLLVTGHIDQARDILELLMSDVPDEPDWLKSAIALALTDTYLLLGEEQQALQLQDFHADDNDLRQRLAYVFNDDAAANDGDLDVLLRTTSLARLIYGGQLDAAETQLATFGNSTDNMLVQFYRGELAFMRQRWRTALEAYDSLTAEELPDRLRLFKFFAFNRSAEAHAQMGETQEAAKVLSEVLKFYGDADLMRHATKARRRYFDHDRPGYDSSASTGITTVGSTTP